MTEIMLMGTFHFPDHFKIFSEETQKEIQKICDRIAAWKPDRIAIEFPMREQAAIDQYYREFDPAVKENQRLGTMKRYGKVVEDTYCNEAFQIGFRTAKHLGLQGVYGIDEDMEIPDEIAEPVVSQIADELKELQAFLQSHTETLTEQLLLHNSQEFIRRNTLLYIKANRVNLGNYEGSMFNAIWCKRNLKIFSNLQSICQDGQKIFLLIGSEHQKILAGVLPRSPVEAVFNGLNLPQSGEVPLQMPVSSAKPPPTVFCPLSVHPGNANCAVSPAPPPETPFLHPYRPAAAT